MRRLVIALLVMSAACCASTHSIVNPGTGKIVGEPAATPAASAIGGPRKYGDGGQITFGGLMRVSHDATITGYGTPSTPLAVASTFVTGTLTANTLPMASGPHTLVDSPLLYDGSTTLSTTKKVAMGILNQSSFPIVAPVGPTLNDYDPWSGGAHTPYVEVDLTNVASSDLTITGIIAGVDGDDLTVWCGGGSPANAPDTCTFTNNDVGSTALNRIWIGNGKYVHIANNDALRLHYIGGFGWVSTTMLSSIVRAQEFSLDLVCTPTTLVSGNTYTDWQPSATCTAGYASNIRVDVSGGGTATVSGLKFAGPPNQEGRLIALQNISTTSSIAILNDVGSAGNHVLTPPAATITLGPKQTAMMIYDRTNGYWRVASYTGSSGLGTGTVTSVATTAPITGGTFTTSGTIGINLGTGVTTSGANLIADLGNGLTLSGNHITINNGTGLTLVGAAETLNINAGVSQNCGAGTATTGLNGTGIIACSTLATLGAAAGTGSTNTIPKWSNTSGLLTNSSLADNGTTVSTTEAVSWGATVTTGTYAIETASTPATFSANQNDYAGCTTSNCRIGPTASVDVTGFVAGSAGELLTVTNVDATHVATYRYESTGSSVANRLKLPDAADSWKLNPYCSSTFVYDGTLSRWVLINWACDTMSGNPTLGFSSASSVFTVNALDDVFNAQFGTAFDDTLNEFAIKDGTSENTGTGAGLAFYGNTAGTGSPVIAGGIKALKVDSTSGHTNFDLVLGARANAAGNINEDLRLLGGGGAKVTGAFEITGAGSFDSTGSFGGAVTLTTLTATTLVAVDGSKNTISFAGSTPGACTAGSLTSQPTLSAAGVVANNCTTLASAGNSSGAGSTTQYFRGDGTWVVPPGTLIGKQTLTATSGTYTPTSGTHAVYLEMIGGGGAGGGTPTTTSTQAAGGGGGSAGTYSTKYIACGGACTGGSYAAGAGGTASAGALGGDGNDTTITVNGTAFTIKSGKGGAVGIAATTSNVVAGGGIGGVDVGTVDTERGPSGFGRTGIVITNGSTPICIGGEGGSSPYSSGGQAKITQGAGNPAQSGSVSGVHAGGGGSGACALPSSASTLAGGAGQAGVIRIWEYNLYRLIAGSPANDNGARFSLPSIGRAVDDRSGIEALRAAM